MIRVNTAVRYFARSFFPYSKPAIFSSKDLLTNCIEEDIAYGKNLYKPDQRIFDYLKKNSFEVSDSNTSSRITLTTLKDDSKITIDFESDKITQALISEADLKNEEQEDEPTLKENEKKVKDNKIVFDELTIQKIMEQNFLLKKNLKRALIEREQSEVSIDDLRQYAYYFHIKVLNNKTEKGVVFLCFVHDLKLQIKNIINLEQVRQNLNNPQPHKRDYQGPNVLKLNNDLKMAFHDYIHDLLLESGLLEVVGLMMIDKNKRLEMVWKKSVFDMLSGSS